MALQEVTDFLGPNNCEHRQGLYTLQEIVSQLSILDKISYEKQLMPTP